jgi:hypothetical protein
MVNITLFKYGTPMLLLLLLLLSKPTQEKHMEQRGGERNDGERKPLHIIYKYMRARKLFIFKDGDTTAR